MLLIKRSAFFILLAIPLILIPAGCGESSDSIPNVISNLLCEESIIQAAIDSASDGDIVLLPAGTCSWPTGVSIPSTKSIQLKGAGETATTINYTGNSYAIRVQSANGKSVRITGMTFKGYRGIRIRGDTKSFRIDHCRFEGISLVAILVDGYAYGVIDNCVFTGPQNFYGIHVYANSGDGGEAAWGRPLSLGTANAVYVEDCIFDFDSGAEAIPAIDSRSGGRYAFRYNTVNHIVIGTHDACSSQQRGVFSYEVYENTFDHSNGRFRGLNFRGGTGVVFNNTFTGIYSGQVMAWTNYRSGLGGCGDPWDNWCDDVDELMCSDLPLACTTDSQCDPSGGTCTRVLDANIDGTGYPCRDQAGRTSDENNDGIQDLAPIYEWNNTVNGGNANIAIYGGSLIGDHVKLGRDVYNDTQRPGYTPYTYPHPLRSLFP